MKVLQLDYKTRAASAPVTTLRLPPSIEILVIDGANGFTDDDLARIAGLSHLHELVLDRCELVTDQGLEHLKRLQGVKRFDVRWCLNTTEAAANSMRSAMPGCRIRDYRGGGSFMLWDPFYDP